MTIEKIATALIKGTIYSNKEIAEIIRNGRPNANTSAACISWYKNKMKNEKK